MNVQINQLVKTLLQKESIDLCSVQELRQFADRHPYFGAAQLLLTKKLQSENAEQYNEQLQKTFLFFHNPLWVEQLLNETGNGEIIAAPKQEPVLNGVLKDKVVTPIENKRPGEPVIADEIKAETSLIPVAQIEEPVIDTPALTSEPVEQVKTEMLFEPFYTVDYFASQGIKFKEEEKPKDKFGQQLKSFTEWLKSMKRLPVAETALAETIKPDQKVEQLAETSLQDRDVITEAMAAVWEKQGNNDKAIAIYNKLCLLDPSKSAYFAAKIEALKKIN